MEEENQTTDSSILDLLEDDDDILTDKGFPEIKTELHEKEKSLLIVQRLRL